ncbi:argininosuccinate lyase [Natranaerobius thermophilus]|uniref:Argininosuccinate lyase n=1 Tax=Natranaerobius thermophilus (strain ATCC BAA-1301 / DSM 18059 / JW/NM-WN-LF) TaxID=457570 RepID=ARLY_NATTJ|nr:argininosuccinate lyase [Natranaerobius thermophilus]B2A8E3.1 RecName: Full=Argininosuccinate lyase; Short=ASAL; AltName: Full=Arginosuccinase [Natranaerobius thermophilus JW/NM-WN-LF]ACB84507.1 argininosuccinate lyase [Natranaerobius thermophilus JW/NM-WN-LF]
MSKLWGGRFSKQTDQLVDEFNASIEFDNRLIFYDLLGSQAHVKMLFQQGIIDTTDYKQITEGLDIIWKEAEQDKLEFNLSDEDIHMSIEKRLIELKGEVGKKLHTARSRNDQVAVDMNMFLCDKAIKLVNELLQNMSVIKELSEQHTKTYMPGYTHLQRAQPTTLGHHMLNYFWKFQRDASRLIDFRNRADLSPLGSGAFAGTGFNISRRSTRKDLGFTQQFENSMDAVSSRDLSLEFIFCLSSIMINLSRLAEELILWSTKEFDFIELDDAFATGSSIMPQKKNPDVPELIRGKTGRVVGHLTALATTYKGLPMAYNKDFQEDKEGLFDSLDTVESSLKLTSKILSTMTIKTKNMEKALYQDFSNATDIADYLATQGIPFRDAHAVVGQLVKHCQEHNKLFYQLTEQELDISFKQIADSLEENSQQILTQMDTTKILNIMDPIKCVHNRNSRGAPAPEALQFQLGQAQKYFHSLTEQVKTYQSFLP